MSCARWIGWVTPLWLLACAELPSLPSGECGNGVREEEQREDCDTSAPDGQACRPPGVEGACRYDCSPRDGGAARCPSGSACGLDGICRFWQTPREYEDWAQFLPLPAHAVRLGDFDGDGRQDLLALGNPNSDGRSLPKILFFDEAGTPRDVFDLQMPISSPDIARLHDEADPNLPESQSDRRQQIVFSTAYGMATLEANRDGLVLPIAYPFQVLPGGWSYRVLRVRGSVASPLGEGVLVFWGEPSATVPVVHVIAADRGEIGMMDGSLGRLAGEPIAADVIDGADSPCEEALVAFHGEGSVQLLDACDSSGRWREPRSLEARSVVTLTGGHTIEQGVLAVDIDQDGHLDLLLGDELGTPHAAFGRGDGTFVADPYQPEATLGMAWPVEVTAGDCMAPSTVDRRSDFPLAVGRLDDDAWSDWVTPGGILLTQPVSFDTEKVILPTCVAYVPSVAPWSIAKVADLNRDDLPDVVAGFATEPGLELWRGTGMVHLNPLKTIDTSGPVSHMVIGDFDGDLVQDVAFGERVTDTGQSRAKLAIAYGNMVGDPTAAVDVAEVAAIEQLASAQYSGSDAIEEIGAVALPCDQCGEELSVFVGNPGRHPIASLGLARVAGPLGSMVAGTPFASALGRFGEDAHQSAIALAIDNPQDWRSPWRLWLVPGEGNANFGDPIPSDPLPPNVVPFHDASDAHDTFSIHVFGATRRDGVDEAYLLTPTHDTGPTITLSRVVLPSPGQSWEVEPLSSTPGRLVQHSTPELVDLDGDGLRDLVMIAGDGSEHQLLWIFWNESGDGSFDLSDPFQPIGLGQQPVQGFSLVRDGDTTRLVVVTAGAVYEIPAGAGAGRNLEAKQILQAVDGGEAIALGDVTGDGLLDLVIAVPGGVRVYKEVPQRP